LRSAATEYSSQLAFVERHEPQRTVEKLEGY
jgi:hypothetical protein